MERLQRGRSNPISSSHGLLFAIGVLFALVALIDGPGAWSTSHPGYRKASEDERRAAGPRKNMLVNRRAKIQDLSEKRQD